MAVTAWTGKKEPWLLAKIDALQDQLLVGRVTEVRLAGETVRTDGPDYIPIKSQIEELNEELCNLQDRGETSGDRIYYRAGAQSGVTIQRFL